MRTSFNQQYSALLLLIFCSFSFCQIDRTVKDFKQELTQPQLQKGDNEALLWGQSKDRFIKCSTENKYYDIIQYNWTMTKEFNESRQITEAHDGLIVSFSFIFANFDSSYISKYVSSTISFDDTNKRYFRALIQSTNQGCNYNGYDGTGSITLYIPHTSSTLKVFINAALTGVDQKLGIRDLTIQTVKCIGSNSQFSVLDGQCYCDQGYTQVNFTLYGSPLKICQKNK